MGRSSGKDSKRIKAVNNQRGIKQPENEWVNLNQFRDTLRAAPYDPLPARDPLPHEQRIIVSDLHGNYRNLYRLLLKTGAINPDGSRNEGFWVCQIGDLMHGGGDVWQADKDSVLLGGAWIDSQLVGNHDLAHLSRRFQSSFLNQHRRLDKDITKWLETGIANSTWRAAQEVDGWIVSHAGIDPRIIPKEWQDKSPAETATLLNEEFYSQIFGKVGPADQLLNAISNRRGGRDSSGSIFWSDEDDLLEGYAKTDSSLNQIVGHSARPENPRRDGRVWLTDCYGVEEGKVAAMVKSQDESEWEPIIVDRSTRPDALSDADQVLISSSLL